MDAESVFADQGVRLTLSKRKTPRHFSRPTPWKRHGGLYAPAEANATAKRLRAKGWEVRVR